MQIGTKKSLVKFTKNTTISKEEKARKELDQQRKLAKHGDFFFCQFVINSGEVRKSPVFVVSNIIDNKDDDIIVCSCTKQPAKSQFDIEVQLKVKTCVRTNKIYTIHRNDLLFKIPQTIDINSDKMKEIDSKIKLALDLK